MKKIIIAFDGRHFPEGAMEMAAWLDQREKVLLAGVFLSPIDYREVIGYSGIGMGGPVVMPPFEEDDRMVQTVIARFEEHCQRQGLEYRVHKDTELFALQELIRETRFADLLMLSSELFYENIEKEQPNEYLRKTLHDSECPVMLVPERFRAPESLVMTYDGKASSVYAIRQFAYLFPELSELECLLVGADEEPDASLPQAQLIEELVSRHYPHLTIRHFAGEDREGFRQWLGARQDCLLVTGAYGRGEVSSLFRKSFVADLIREHRMPIFIAHG
jgi:nucleotide-binding universal stress UspA family protein